MNDLLGKLRKLLCTLLFGLLSACASDPLQVFASKASEALSSGIDDYNEGRYPEAVKSLQRALELGLDVSDQVRAHKYLAFTHCSNGKERPCREEFRKALTIYPEMELKPTEVGHPLLGPVFRSVKAKQAEAKR